MRIILTLAALAMLPAFTALDAMAQSQRVSRSAFNRPDLIAFQEDDRLRRQARLDCVAGAEQLRARILMHSADALADAKAAARDGCFAMITTDTAVPGGYPYALGVDCRPNTEMFSYGRLSMFSYGGSDVPDVERMERERRTFPILMAYALAYNRSIAESANFPYRDLCRLAPDDYRPSDEEVLPSSWGHRDLQQTHVPIDIHEASRRGTIAALRRLIAKRPADVHSLDVVGLTPLAWAVLYNRPQQVRVLIDAGANPYGELYRTSPTPFSAMTLAENSMNCALIRRLRAAARARGLDSLRDQGMCSSAGRTRARMR